MKKMYIKFLLGIVCSLLFISGCNSSTPTPSQSTEVTIQTNAADTSRSNDSMDTESLPLQPMNPEAHATSSTTVEIKWLDNSDNEKGFRIYRGATLIGTVAANKSSFQDTGIQPKTEYTYAIRAFDQTGESSVSTCCITTPGPPTAPQTLTTIDYTQTSIQLKWTDTSDDEAGFRIYRDNVPVIDLGSDSTTHADINLQAATSYTYSVRAYNQYGESEPCLLTAKTRNPGITIKLDSIGVYDNRESLLRGFGDIYVLIGIADGDTTKEIKLPAVEGQTFSLDKNETTSIGQTIYSTNEVSDNLRIFFIGYESDGGAFEQLAYQAIGIGLDYYTAGATSGIAEAFDTSLADAIGDMFGEEDDFLGRYEISCNQNNNWGTGQYTNIVLEDERGIDCLRLWFSISFN